MTLTSCSDPACDAQISELAPSCPKCGAIQQRGGSRQAMQRPVVRDIVATVGGGVLLALVLWLTGAFKNRLSTDAYDRLRRETLSGLLADNQLVGSMIQSIGHDERFRGAVGGKGPAGERGPEGSQGQRGDQGLKGGPGLKGDPGPRGDQGQKGDIGSQGARGEKGDRGPKGSSANLREVWQTLHDHLDESGSLNGAELRKACKGKL